MEISVHCKKLLLLDSKARYTKITFTTIFCPP